MKLEPCKTENSRHNWLWECNGYGIRKRRGVYLCTACGAVKYGKTLEQVHVVVLDTKE